MESDASEGDAEGMVRKGLVRIRMGRKILHALARWAGGFPSPVGEEHIRICLGWVWFGLGWVWVGLSFGFAFGLVRSWVWVAFCFGFGVGFVWFGFGFGLAFVPRPKSSLGTSKASPGNPLER